MSNEKFDTSEKPRVLIAFDRNICFFFQKWGIIWVFFFTLYEECDNMEYSLQSISAYN